MGGASGRRRGATPIQEPCCQTGERPSGDRLTAALSAITAAVVGVILNLAVWFSVHVVFGEVLEQAGPLGARLLVPVWSTVDPAAVVIAAGAFVALFRFEVGMIRTLLAAAVLGMGWRLVLGG